MQYSINKQEQYTVLTLEVDKLDSLQAPALKSELVTLSNSGTQSLILNMSTVKYADSSGLSAILVANRLCKEAGGWFVMCGVQAMVEKLLTISQLNNILEILPTEHEAIELVLMNIMEKQLKAGDE